MSSLFSLGMRQIHLTVLCLGYDGRNRIAVPTDGAEARLGPEEFLYLDKVNTAKQNRPLLTHALGL